MEAIKSSARLKHIAGSHCHQDRRCSSAGWTHSDVGAQACCQAYHLAEKTPLEAEALMRARFSAYVKKDANFLVSSCNLARCKHTAGTLMLYTHAACLTCSHDEAL